MLNVPSGFANQPSNAPVMDCPDSCGGSSGRVCAAAAAQQQRNAAASLLGGTRADPFRLVPGDPILVVIFGNIRHVDPGVRHLVDGAVAIADPLVGVGIVGVCRRVVVPGGDMDDGAFGQYRGGIVGVDVVVHPVEVEMVDVAQHLGRAVGEDGFHGHGFAS